MVASRSSHDPADALARSLTKRGKGGVWFLYGEDEFQKEEAAKALVEAHLDPATRDFNHDVLRGSEVSVEDLASILATPPMMAEWRVVHVRETEAFASSSRARDVVMGVVEKPPPDLAVVLVASIPSGSRARFYRDLQSGAKAVEFPAVSPDDVPGWLMTRALDVHGKEMDQDAARALGMAIGTDLGILARELEKLVEVTGERPMITVAEVEAAGTRLPTQDRWRWFDLVGERRFEEALRGLPVLLGQNESGVGLTIGLATHLLRLGVLAEGGYPALVEALPRHQKWLAGRLKGQGRKWSGRAVEEALLGLRRVDTLLKSSALSDQHLLEEWILGLMAGEAEAA